MYYWHGDNPASYFIHGSVKKLINMHSEPTFPLWRRKGLQRLCSCRQSNSLHAQYVLQIVTNEEVCKPLATFVNRTIHLTNTLHTCCVLSYLSLFEAFSCVKLWPWTFEWDLTLQLLLWSVYTWLELKYMDRTTHLDLKNVRLQFNFLCTYVIVIGGNEASSWLASFWRLQRSYPLNLRWILLSWHFKLILL